VGAGIIELILVEKIVQDVLTLKGVIILHLKNTIYYLNHRTIAVLFAEEPTTVLLELKTFVWIIAMKLVGFADSCVIAVTELLAC